MVKERSPGPAANSGKVEPADGAEEAGRAMGAALQPSSGLGVVG